jgi:ABC-2 type transport system ATP-binding protein
VDASDADGLWADRETDSGQQRHDERRLVRKEELPLAISARGLSHQFPARRSLFKPGRPAVRALSPISFSVEAGRFVAITGRNGAGKTTLLEILSTLIVPSGGEALVEGFDVRQAGTEVRRRIAHCPSGHASFWPRLTGLENLQFFAALAGSAAGRRADRARAAALDVGLTDDVIEREVRTYSDGQAQRLNLARALLRDASVWLIDEPTRSLDPEGQAAIWTLIRDRARERGATVLAATHDVIGVAGIADGTVALS